VKRIETGCKKMKLDDIMFSKNGEEKTEEVVEVENEEEDEEEDKLSFPNHYFVDSRLEIVMDRVRDAENNKRDAIVNKWEPASSDDLNNACGNVKVYLIDGHIELCSIGNTPSMDNQASIGNGENARVWSFERMISAGLLLYRLLVLFHKTETEDIDDYKCVWEVPLKHKTTGKFAMFGDYKGGVNLWLHAYKQEDLNPDFVADLKELIEMLISMWMPLNYDGTIAGSVA
jgi:hypothetical protein